MDNFKTHKKQSWLSLSTFLYGLSLAFIHTPLRIVDFPPRFYLIVACLIIPLVNLYTLYKGHFNIARWGVVALTFLWSNVGVLYAINPIPNGGWVLAIAIIGFAVIALYDGGAES